MKKFLCFLFLACCISGIKAQDNVIDEIVWVVGDDAILRSDVEAQRLYLLNSGERLDGDPYCVIPEQMAVQKLFLHQAVLDSVEVSDTEVLSMVDQRMNYYIQQVGSKEKFEEYMNMTSTQIREKWRFPFSGAGSTLSPSRCLATSPTILATRRA